MFCYIFFLYKLKKRINFTLKPLIIFLISNITKIKIKVYIIWKFDFSICKYFFIIKVVFFFKKFIKDITNIYLYNLLFIFLITQLIDN